MTNLVKMDFGNIIYIIIGVAWLLYSFNRKKQRSQARNNPQPPQPGQEPVSPKTEDLKSIFEQLITGQPYSVPAPAVTSVEEGSVLTEETELLKQETEKKVGRFIKPDRDSVEHKDYRIYKKRDADKQRLEVLEENAVADQLDFDIRKAVIYSEILNKPTY